MPNESISRPVGGDSSLLEDKRYSFAGNKKILQQVPSRLKEGNEAVGKLLDVLEMDDFVVAAFNFGLISLPLELAGELRELQGKKLAILHLDGWHVRLIDMGTYD